jgi:hypothetical protein
VLLAGSASGVLAASRSGASAWTTISLGDATSKGVAITTLAGGNAIGLIRSNANSGELRYTIFGASGWTPFSAIAAGVTTRDRPSIAALGGTAVAAFQGNNYMHYFAAFDASWLATSEPIGGAANQSFGPTPAAIASIGLNSIVAYVGNDGDLWDQTRASGSWQSANAHGQSNLSSGSIGPSIVRLDSDPDLLIVLVRPSDKAILWTAHSASKWGAPAVIPMGLSADPIAIAPLAGGGAVIAYRGLDGGVYTASYAPAATPAWTLPVPLATPNYATPAPPAIARGRNDALAELAFVDAADGSVKHSIATLNGWSAPAAVGGSAMTSVAIATLP